jgi:hypothetical protein
MAEGASSSIFTSGTCRKDTVCFDTAGDFSVVLFGDVSHDAMLLHSAEFNEHAHCP